MQRPVPRERKGPYRGIAVAVAALLFVAWGVRAAFSIGLPDNAEPLEPDLALSVFAFGVDRGDGPTLADLSRLTFADEGAGVDATSASEEDEDAEPEVAPRWTETRGDDEPEPEIPEQRFRVTTHRVRSGDSLRSIASRHGIAVRTIVSYNRLAHHVVRPGQVLEIPNVDGVRIRIDRGDALWDITRRHRINLKDILEFNGLDRGGDVRAGQFLFLPGARELPKPSEASRERRRPGAAPSGAVRDRSWSSPISAGRLSSRFGYRRHPITGKIRFHRGIDIAAPHGAPIRALKGGVIVFSGPRGGYGFTVDIRHENGVITRYAHNSKNLVRVGQRVRSGDVIAKVGSTGASTGPHIHFEVIRNGDRIDPIKYLRRG